MNGLRFSTQQVLTAGSSSSASDAFGANTEYIRVVSTIAAYIQIAVSPTAWAISISSLEHKCLPERCK